jgi:RNA polymerase sigma-70 factor (ECF subfamily)
MPVPETRESLLIRVKEGDDAQAWAEFTSIYRPAIYRLARKRGLQDADSEDVAQRVMLAVAKAIDTWQLDRERGKFRNWLFCVARNAITNALTRRKPDAPVGGSKYGGSSNLEQIAHLPLKKGLHSENDFGSAAELTESITKIHDGAWSECSVEEIEFEYRRGLFRLAAAQVRDQFEESTWNAFWLTAVDELSVQQVAEQLGKNIGAIYTARSRVINAIKKRVAKFVEDELEK